MLVLFIRHVTISLKYFEKELKCWWEHAQFDDQDTARELGAEALDW